MSNFCWLKNSFLSAMLRSSNFDHDILLVIALDKNVLSLLTLGITKFLSFFMFCGFFHTLLHLWPAYKCFMSVFFQLALVSCLFLKLIGHRPNWSELMYLGFNYFHSKTEVHTLTYDLSSPKRNTKPMLFVRKQVDKRIESEIWWQYSIKCDLHAILKGRSFLTWNTKLRLRLHDKDAIKNGKVFPLRLKKSFTYIQQCFPNDSCLHISAKTAKNAVLRVPGQ